MTNSNQKGKAGERELVHVLQGYGYNARRGAQHKGGPDSPDVEGLPGVHIEVKRWKEITDGDIGKALKQAKRDAREGELPAAFTRADYDSWRVTVELSALYEFIGEKIPGAFNSQKRVRLALPAFMEIYQYVKGVPEHD